MLRVIIPASLVMLIVSSFTGTNDVPLFLLLPITFVVLTNLGSALLAFNVTSTLKRERQQNTYDLLALTPTGRGASNWLIATAWTRRLQVIERLGSLRTLMSVLVVLLSVIVSQNGGFTPMLAVGLMLALNFDAIQTVISGCLSGILAQELGESGSPFIALALFAFVQLILVYLPVTLVLIPLFIALRSTIPSVLLADALLSVILIGLPFAIREILFRLLWRELERRLL